MTPLIEPPPASMQPREFSLFRELIHRETGIWLRDGKHAMLASRLARRLRHHGLRTFADYFSLLEQARDGGREIAQLINCVTTNKTSFFREPHHFDFLRGTVVPGLRNAASPARSIHIWSAACSTGEEPYSIAISLLEALPPGCQITVTASDIDTAVLHTAAAAIYDEHSLAGLAPALRAKYFLRGKAAMAGKVRVKPAVTDRVRFQRINLMEKTWPLESPCDAIFFRNALIYFKRETQDLFLRRMVRCLRPHGYLFLGHSEHIPWLHEILEPLNNTIYRLRQAS